MKTKFTHKKMIKVIAALVMLISFYQKTNAQLLDSLTLDSLAPYTSIEEGLKHPELVIKLELRKKKLKKFPIEILQFTNLQYLDLSRNDIEELPDEIGQLKNLQYFAISKNGLQELPPQIGNLKNLYYLEINNNELTALPWEIGKLEKLRSLDLWSNNIDKFPDQIKDLKNLRFMDLRVIMIPDKEQARVQAMLPNTKIEFSPFCKCEQ